MPATDEEVIDLTLSDDEVDNQPDSRRKRTRYNDDDEVVIVEGDAAVPKPSEPETANDVGDDEVKLVSSTGVEDWTSLPHTRDLCRQCPFKLGMQTTNAQYCARCFCYICDCPASECKEWGTGVARAHHCNATAKSPTYRAQRQDHLKLNRAKAKNPANAAATAAAASGSGAGAAKSQALADKEAFAAFLTAEREKFDQERAERREKMRAAELEQRAKELERFKARTEALAASLPTTVHRPTESAGTDPEPDDEDSDACGCPNCRRRRGGYDDIDYPYGYDSDDMPLPSYYAGLAAAAKKKEQAPKKCNAKQMTDPLKDPNMIELTTLTLQVEALGNNKISELASRVVPHGFYSPSPSTPRQEFGDKLTLATLLEYRTQPDGRHQPSIKLSPITFTPPPPEPSSNRIVPVVVSFWDGRAAPTKFGVTVESGSTVADLKENLIKMLDIDPVLDIRVRLKIPRDYTGTQDTDVINDDWLQRNAYYGSNPHVKMTADCLPNTSSVEHRSNKDRKESPIVLIKIKWLSPSDEMGRISQPPLVMLPLDERHVKGGRDACKDVARSVIAALRPYRLNPGDENETLRLVDGLKTRLSWGHLTYGERLPFDNSTPDTQGMSTSDYLVMSQGAKLIKVTATFPETDLEAFNLEFWKDPLVIDPSASPEALKTTEDYIKAREKVRVLNNEENSLPQQIIKELEESSKMWDPAVSLPAAIAAAAVAPLALVRYKAELTPGVQEITKGKRTIKEKDEKNGVLKIRVFVYRKSARYCSGFFDQGNDWGGAAATTARVSRNRQRSIVPHKLKLTLCSHLKQNAEFIALEEHRKQWGEKDQILSARRSITALMEAMERLEAPAAVQPRGLTVTLRPYQLQSLRFMMDAERCVGGFRKHLWVPATAADGTPFWYSPLLGRVASDVPAQSSGGFCCEEMGLGKTVEVLALCLANPALPLPAPGTLLPSKKLHSRATLVVCAVSLVGQWITEAKEKTGGSLKIHMYHGPDRIKNARRLATEFDLVVTTYATLSADCGKMNNQRARNGASTGSGSTKNTFTTDNSPLHGVQWYRLVLDESHTCKNPAVGHTKACVALDSQRRWMCTGTPINTDVQDLFGQFAVLGFAPFNNRTFFDSNVKNAFGNNVYGGGCPELLHALGAIMVRHTKRQELGGEQVLQLPPKTEELVPVILNASEQAVYKRVHKTASEYFSRYERLGPHACSKHLLHIMSLLLPMRRICSGGALLERDLTVTEPDALIMQQSQVVADYGFNNNTNNSSSAIADLKVDESLVAPAGEECPICMDAYEEPAVTTCNHWYCKACIVNVLQTMQSRCPLCRGILRVNQLRCGITAAEAAERNAENEDTDAAQIASQTAADAAAAAKLAEREAAIVSIGDGLISESKLAALLKSLRAMRRADPSAKALIFSQYNSTIEWLKGRLTREGFGHRHISGSMPLKQRAKAIQAFQGDPPTTVFLLSMRSGAVGINLTAASHVFLLEPALNPALEDQAVGRAWRMGQRREVKVVRFYVKGSVEEQIMEVVKRRQTGVAGAAAANANDGASGSGGAGPSRIMYDSDEERYRQRHRPHIRVEDQAGSIKEDKQNLRLSELQALFKTPEFPEPRGDEALSGEEEDEVMRDATAGGQEEEDEMDYAALYQRSSRPQQQQQQQQAMEIDDEAGTSAMHAAIGMSHKPAAMMKNRMRRSKAGIASVAAVAATPGGVNAANNINITDAAGAGPSNRLSSDASALTNGNGTTAANGVTPAATLHTAPATGARQPAPATAAAPAAQEEEEVIEMAPAAILQRIKLLAQRGSGRLTPAVNGAVGTQRAAAASKAAKAADLVDEPDTDEEEELSEEALEKLLEQGSPEQNKTKKRRGRPLSRGSHGAEEGAEIEAITAHLPNPTPDASGGVGGGSDSGSGRPSRRGSRLNYAVLATQGADVGDANAAT